MYKTNKVYSTTEGKPARILWIESESFARLAGVEVRLMFAVHEPYTEFECVRKHVFEGGFCLNDDSRFDLTDNEYDG